MTGVEILATQEVATEFAFKWLNFWLVIGVCFGVLLMVGIIAALIEDDMQPFVICLIAGIFLGLLLGTIVGSQNMSPVEYETQYKVIISDEVPMNEFLDRYEIVDQDGKIYIVRERD